MIDELLAKAVIAPAIVDVLITLFSALLIKDFASLSASVTLIIILALLISSVAFMVSLVRRGLHLARVRSLMLSRCEGVVRYNFKRDVLICTERRESSLKGLCYSAQEGRLYCVEVNGVSASSDPKDFYCVRFDEGVFEDKDDASTYRGRLRVLTGEGVVEGIGSVVLLRSKSQGLSLDANIC
ncbi:MAG: hypothetical protein ACP5HK_05435 [Acidilobus sp.]